MEDGRIIGEIKLGILVYRRKLKSTSKGERTNGVMSAG